VTLCYESAQKKLHRDRNTYLFFKRQQQLNHQFSNSKYPTEKLEHDEYVLFHSCNIIVSQSNSCNHKTQSTACVTVDTVEL